MDKNFLINNQIAQRLYHECAEKLPIIDYHNHLCVSDLAEDKQFKNLAELWIAADPYKHRAMRILGVDEKYITGDGEDYDKYMAWMDTLAQLQGNPLYDWSILEMKRVFDIELTPETADYNEIWNLANKKLQESKYSALGILSKFNVEYAAPCTSINDNLSLFYELKQVSPSLRGDNIVNITPKTINELSLLTQIEINTLDDFFRAISKRLDEFNALGCRFSDHALDNGFIYYEDDGLNNERFQKLFHNTLSDIDRKRLFSAILRGLAKEYAKRGWTMQLHIGAQRETSTRLRRIAGPAGGYAGIGNCCDVISLTKMLDDFENPQKSPDGPTELPNILLFTLNPADNAVMSVLSGAFTQAGVRGKVQQGPAWWWCDHLFGIRESFETISAFGVLSAFIGMTTDSRSILSMVRHEYFRRALCGWLGEKAEKGELPDSFEVLKQIVYQVCYGNAKKRLEERYEF